jgi:hypothetical protein
MVILRDHSRPALGVEWDERGSVAPEPPSHALANREGARGAAQAPSDDFASALLAEELALCPALLAAHFAVLSGLHELRGLYGGRLARGRHEKSRAERERCEKRHGSVL